MIMEIFETERLRFREWRESDVEDLFLCASDPDIGERAGWPPHQTVEDSLMVIKNIFSNGHTWALELKETGHVIGCMGYYTHTESNIEIGEQDVEVGYWIGKPYWNKGYCTEALHAMIDYCFRRRRYNNIWADFFVDNPASGRVMEKCGFRDTGRTNILSKLYHSESRPVKIMKLTY